MLLLLIRSTQTFCVSAPSRKPRSHKTKQRKKPCRRVADQSIDCQNNIPLLGWIHTPCIILEVQTITIFCYGMKMIVTNATSDQESSGVVLSLVVTNAVDEKRMRLAVVSPETESLLVTVTASHYPRHKQYSHVLYMLVIIAITTLVDFTDWPWYTANTANIDPQERVESIKPDTSPTTIHNNSMTATSRSKECKAVVRNEIPPLGCVFVYSMKHNGICSQLMNLFANWAYSHGVLERPFFLVDESRYLHWRYWCLGRIFYSSISLVSAS